MIHNSEMVPDHIGLTDFIGCSGVRIGIPDHRRSNCNIIMGCRKYQWSLFVIDSSDAQKRQFLDNGVFEIKPNWASSIVDPRSDARKNQELIEDILYNRIQGDVSSYSVAG